MARRKRPVDVALMRAVACVVSAAVLVGCVTRPPAAEEDPAAATAAPPVAALVASEEPASEPEPEPEPEPETDAAPVSDPAPSAAEERAVIAVAVRKVRLAADGSVERVTVVDADENGVVVKEETRNAAGQIVETVQYTYDGERLVERAVRDGRLALVSARRYTYAAAGVESETLVDGRGLPQTRTLTAYDERGLPRNWTLYDGSGALLGTVVHRHDGGLLAESELRDPSGRTESYTVYERDGEGLVVAERTLSASRAVERTVERTYVGGFLTGERTLSGRGAIERSVVYENDDRGNPVKMVTLNAAGRVLSTTTFEYRFFER